MVAIQVPQLQPDDWFEDDEAVAAPRHSPAPLHVVRRRPLPDRATRVRRRRLALLLAVLVTSLVGWGAVRFVVSEVFGPAVGGSGPEPLRTTDGVYVVQPGDTLWSIAERMAPDADPRPIVAELRERYGEASIDAGDRLELDLN